MIKIRPAIIRDRVSIKKIVEMYPEFLVQEIPKMETFFVAEDDGNIIGCCALDIYSKRIAEVRSLAVLNKYRKQGIASKLVRVCLKRAKQKKIQKILTITSSEKLFRRLGFGPFHKEKLALFKVFE